jgi:hypothetical protein
MLPGLKCGELNLDKVGRKFMDPETELASNFTIWNYLEIQVKLRSQDQESSEEWKKVLDAFRRRISERFLKPIEELLKQDKNPTMRSGFAILALDCLLIDTIQSFREGRIKTGESSTAKSFKTFLKAASFSDFKSKDRGEFFADVRNGLFHNGETRGNWKIRRDTDQLLLKTDNSRVINRSIFHKRIIVEFDQLCRDLEVPGSDQRRLFLNRMDGLSGCSRDYPKLIDRILAMLGRHKTTSI